MSRRMMRISQMRICKYVADILKHKIKAQISVEFQLTLVVYLFFISVLSFYLYNWIASIPNSSNYQDFSQLYSLSQIHSLSFDYRKELNLIVFGENYYVNVNGNLYRISLLNVGEGEYA